MTYEKTDSFTGATTVRIKKPIVADMMYPPDYFLKKAVASVKKVGDKIGDTKLASSIRDTKAYQKVAKPILKVAVPAAAAIGLGALAAPLVSKGIQAVQAKKAVKAVDAKLAGSSPVTTIKPLSGSGIVPKVDLVSSVTGTKGTPVIKTGLAGLKEKLVARAGDVPTAIKKEVIARGEQAGKSLLKEGFARLRTSPEMLPKTKEVKEAEELYLATPEETQSSGLPNLQAGGFSISPMVILAVLAVVVAIGFFVKK